VRSQKLSQLGPPTGGDLKNDGPHSKPGGEGAQKEGGSWGVGDAKNGGGHTQTEPRKENDYKDNLYYKRGTTKALM